MDDFYVAAFQNNISAVTAIQTARAENLPVAVMPTPRSLTASCGLSLRFPATNAEEVSTLLRQRLPTEMYHIYRAERLPDGHFSYAELSI